MTESLAVLALTGGAYSGLFTGCRAALFRAGNECALTGLGSVTYATGSGMYAVDGLVFAEAVAYGSVTLKGVIKILVSADGAGIIVCSSGHTVAAYSNVSDVGVLRAIIVRGKRAVAYAAALTDSESLTGCRAARMTKRGALGDTAAFAILSLGTGSVIPLVTVRLCVFVMAAVADRALGTGSRTAFVSAKLAVRLGASVTDSKLVTVSLAAGVSESLAYGSGAVFTMLSLGTGSLDPIVAGCLAVGILASVAYRGGFAGSISAYVAKLLTVHSTAHGTVLGIGTGSLDPIMVFTLTVGLITALAYSGRVAACASAGVSECLTLLRLAELTDLRVGTGCILPYVLTFAVVFAVTEYIDVTGSHTGNYSDKHEEREHEY